MDSWQWYKDKLLAGQFETHFERAESGGKA